MKLDTRKIALFSMFAALAYALMFFIRIPIVPMPPLNYEPKDAIIVIAGFLFGPMAPLFISPVVSLVEMFTVSVTGPWGLLMNVLSTCAFACTAAVLYRWKRTLAGAAAGLIIGGLFSTGFMLLWNYFVVPYYLGYPRAAVAEMLIPVFLPFNLLKNGLNTGFTLLLYKPARLALSRARLMPEISRPAGRNVSAGVMIASLLLIVSCVLWILTWRRIL